MRIEIDNLRKCFGDKTAINIPSLRINHGEIIGLVGNNGAGKTTLFRLILDLLRADEGHVTLFAPADAGEDEMAIDPAQSEEWKSMTGAYIDKGFLIDFLTPEEYLDFTAKVYGLPPIDWTNCDNGPMQTFVQLASDEIFGQNKYIRNFSAGNMQKIGIIAALFPKPNLVVLDEPFNFLDPSGQNILKQLIVNYHQQTGATILISSHNLQHTVDVSSRIVLLEHGLVVEDLPNQGGSAEETLKEYFKV